MQCSLKDGRNREQFSLITSLIIVCFVLFCLIFKFRVLLTTDKQKILERALRSILHLRLSEIHNRCSYSKYRSELYKSGGVVLPYSKSRGGGGRRPPYSPCSYPLYLALKHSTQSCICQHAHFMTWRPLPALRSSMRSRVASAHDANGVGVDGKPQVC